MADEPTPRLRPEVPARPEGRALPLPDSGEGRPLVLARGNLFCVTSQRGDIAPAGARDLGLFYNDTRHLSYLELFIAGGPPIVLSSDTHGASSAQIDLTLTDSQFGGLLTEAQNFLHLRRKHLLSIDEELVEQLVVTNHLRRPIELWIELRMAADFADVFEVRGARRKRRGTLKPPEFAGDQLLFAYQGLDGELYRTVVRMTPEPSRAGPIGPFWQLKLLPGEATVLELVVQPGRGALPERPRLPLDVRRAQLKAAHQAFVGEATRVTSSHTAFEEALAHDLADLDALRLPLAGHQLLGAGIPWFAAPFGRDALVAAFELLAICPELAASTLRGLAALQGVRDDPFREEEPGKILHELRRGEMARAGEVPHSPYYGTIDATPLWLMLLGESWRWLGDRALVAELLPAAESALGWIERRLREGRGFLYYSPGHEQGLVNQGWKDSRDSVSFPDGTLAEPPIALVEVQGYVVAALDAMAELIAAFGQPQRAATLAERARELRRAIRRAFYVEETGYFALALDGAGRRVGTITSNPGHLLFARAALPDDASRIVDVLLSDGLYSGYGVRTLARGQAVYNPLSYHNGSVWPHDNALCALGCARVGRVDGALRIFDGLFHAAGHFRRHRLPELFCGLGRAEGDFLVHYPVSCSPQAWASAALFLLLQSVLGLEPDAPHRCLTITNPRLPAFLDRVDLTHLRVGRTRLALRFSRHGERTHADVLASEGDPLRVRIELD